MKCYNTFRVDCFACFINCQTIGSKDHSSCTRRLYVWAVFVFLNLYNCICICFLPLWHQSSFLGPRCTKCPLLLHVNCFQGCFVKLIPKSKLQMSVLFIFVFCMFSILYLYFVFLYSCTYIFAPPCELFPRMFLQVNPKIQVL